MKIKKTPDVFTYTDYRKFLKDCFVFKKAENRYYSLRVFAGNAGIKSHGYLNEIIEGKRNLTDKNVFKIVKPFKLSKTQTDYFYNLVFFNQAKDKDEKNKYFTEMVKLQKRPGARTLTASQYVYYSAWFNSAVRAMVGLKGFKDDPEWIARQIAPEVTAVQVKRALKLLMRLGLVKRDEDGKLHQNATRLEVDPDVTSLAIRNFNRSMIDLGKEAIERFGQEEREVSGLTINVTEAGYRRVKEMIRAFKKEVADYVNTEKKDSEIVGQLNFQLFPLTKIKKDSTT